MSSPARDLASFSAGFTPYSVSIDVTTTTTENILANPPIVSKMPDGMGTEVADAEVTA
jgi:hypothetical protein